MAVGLLVLGSLAALSARRDAWRLAEQQSDNLLLALKREIARNVASFDLSLQGVIEARAVPGIAAVSTSIRRHAFFDRAAAAEDFGALVLLDAEGDVVDSSLPLPRGLNFAGREEFAVHRQQPDAGLFIGRATRSWFDDDNPSLWFSRRITSAGGGFDGVVVGALRLSFFSHLFDRLDVGPGGSIALVRTDGHLVWRQPGGNQVVDRDISASDSFRHMAEKEGGRFEAASPLDGTERLYTFGRVGALPLIVAVDLAVDDIYARWRQKAAIIGPTLALMCLAIVVLSFTFRREMLRREAAEQALAQAAEELARLAATDALTGLANRRTFENGYARDWRRAVRTGGMLSVLMVDVDHFKSFNDRYGHQEGDRALLAIATTIERSLDASSSLAARLGGEEFVVLLPDYDAAGALRLAERIRHAVQHLAITHITNPALVATVSVGSATSSPHAEDDPGELLALADRNLYAAKREGRNTVVAGDCLIAHGNPAALVA